MEMSNGIRHLGELIMMLVTQFNRPQTVDISLQVGQILSGMAIMMSG